MRVSPIRGQLASAGAQFTERYGTEVAAVFSDNKTEYYHVRDNAGLTDFSYMQKFSAPEESGFDLLDSLAAGNVAKIRFGRVLHTFIPDDNGMILADCYIANNDDELLVFCESITDDAKLRSIFTASPDVKDLTETHAVFGVDGYKAWAVMKELFGTDILGLPYLSIETYPFEGSEVRLLRAGKTSEFGYLVMVPLEAAVKLWETLESLVKKNGGGLCGSAVHNDLRLEGRFFNVFAEGARVKDPLPLGLQWMIDFDKEQFPGREAILERRKEGLKKKIIGVRTFRENTLTEGMPVFHGDRQVAEIVSSCFSYTLDSVIGLSLFDIDFAYAGLSFNAGSSGGPQIGTISMPPIMPRSLTVKLDEI
ncbi:MAG TPA: glycine cleavage T C-terminal barrel domain-containing protein [Chitinispirillaceae bacterium]|nr:glycine cleavage T C-terminal barrel domain-containing protein [Chitinispirillaceae bacterium]